MNTTPERLEIKLKNPNPIFERWIERWLKEAETRDTRSKYKLREALQSLRSYPLPLASGKDCAILRGFGSTLCNLIDEELKLLKHVTPEIITNVVTYEQDMQQVLKSVKQKTNKNKDQIKQPKLTKKQQKAIAEEEERQREVIMCAGNFRILLIVDTQETSGKNKRTLDQTRSYLESLKIEYEVRRLTVGDFLWIARDKQGNELVLPYIVERKRMDDLASSIRDGRFHEQKHRLRQCGIQHIVYLIEAYGNNEHLGLPLESLQQAIANTQIQNNFIISQTANHWRSMVYLQGMTNTLIKLFKDKILTSVAKSEIKPCQPHDETIGLMKFRELYEDSARSAQLTIREVFIQQLLQLHSLSLEKAVAIVQMYPTPRLLFDAYDSCQTDLERRKLLSNVPCGALQRSLGDKISQIIYDFYRNDF